MPRLPPVTTTIGALTWDLRASVSVPDDRVAKNYGAGVVLPIGTLSHPHYLVRDYDPASNIADPDLAGQLRIRDRGVIPLKRKEALGWAESKALDLDEMFGRVAEAGDQTGAILLRVPQTLKLAIEKSAAVAGVSTNTTLMRCAERAIASDREQKANP